MKSSKIIHVEREKTENILLYFVIESINVLITWLANVKGMKKIVGTS